jgi:hypothetical protein
MMSSMVMESTLGLTGLNMTDNGIKERDLAMVNVCTQMAENMKASSSIILNTDRESSNIEMKAST